MSVFAQISIILIILITAVILFRTNKDLSIASEEGEKFINSSVSTEACPMEETTACKERNYENLRETVSDVRKESSFTALRHPSITLQLLDDRKNKIKQLEVDHYPYTIGRDPGNDLVLNDLCIARFHCEIVEENGLPVLRDKGSINKIYTKGYYVDRLPLEKATDFYIGNQEIMVGEKVERSKATILAYQRERMSMG